jgi:hypothetical protein
VIALRAVQSHLNWKRNESLAMKKTHGFLMIILLSSLILGGCGSRRRNPDGSRRYETEISEKILQAGLDKAITDPLITEFLFDLKDGYVFVTAQRGRADSEITDTMSFSLYFGAVEGQLKVGISDVRVNGFPTSESRVSSWNQKIAQAIDAGLRRRRNSALYDVKITEESITLIWGIYDN